MGFKKQLGLKVTSARTYTAKVSDIDLNRLQTCDESVMVGFTEIADQYLAATGDSAGVKTVGGQLVLDCWQDGPWVSCWVY